MGVAAADSVSDPGATKQVKAVSGGIPAVNHTPFFSKSSDEKRETHA